MKIRPTKEELVQRHSEEPGPSFYIEKNGKVGGQSLLREVPRNEAVNWKYGTLLKRWAHEDLHPGSTVDACTGYGWKDDKITELKPPPRDIGVSRIAEIDILLLDELDIRSTSMQRTRAEFRIRRASEIRTAELTNERDRLIAALEAHDAWREDNNGGT